MDASDAIVALSRKHGFDVSATIRAGNEVLSVRSGFNVSAAIREGDEVLTVLSAGERPISTLQAVRMVAHAGDFIASRMSEQEQVRFWRAVQEIAGGFIASHTPEEEQDRFWDAVRGMAADIVRHVERALTGGECADRECAERKESNSEAWEWEVELEGAYNNRGLGAIVFSTTHRVIALLNKLDVEIMGKRLENALNREIVDIRADVTEARKQG